MLVTNNNKKGEIKMRKYKITTQEAKALIGAKSLINRDEKVFDVTQEDGQAYVIIYNTDLFFTNLAYVKSMFMGLSAKFRYDSPLPASKQITGDDFIF